MNDIFILEKDNFIENIDFSTLEKKYKSEKRNIEYNLGRFLTKFIAKFFYKRDNIEIIDDKKPYFKNSDLYFNISHSNNIAGVCFSKSDVGFDVEFIKDKNLENFSKYFKRDFKDNIDFYKFWTVYEANYKNSSKDNKNATFIFDNYVYSVSNEYTDDIKLFKVFLKKTKEKINIKCLENIETISIKEIEKNLIKKI